MSLKELWRGLDPKGKKKVSIAACLGAVMLFAGVGYQFRTPAEARAPGSAKTRDLTLEPGLLQKSFYHETRQELARRDAQLEELRRQIEGLRSQKEPPSEATARDVSPTPPKPPAPYPLPPQSLRYPPPPAGSYAAMAPAPPRPPVEVVHLGDIGRVSAAEPPPELKKKEAGRRSVFLPPSFMGATLLSGLDAPTVESARGNPIPALLRIKDLAVLPNAVKADLKGCFVIAEGLGNLADERAHLRLVSLSCLSRSGESVIDQKIKGFVVDQDGKIGLRGKVVAKMGAMVARSMIAGFFGGVGEALVQSTSTLSTSALGTTESFDSGDLLTRGAGMGVSSGFKDVQKFYMELARQTMPVIEVGATKDITLVIEEGAELQIRDTGGTL